jgi:flagellar motor switch protein FliG
VSAILAELPFESTAREPRSATEKAAILLATLESSLAVNVLKKLDAQDVKLILGSTASLGPLTSSDVEPLVEEFAGQFADALGISASTKQLMGLLETAFTSEEIADFLGQPTRRQSAFSWNKFAVGMEGTIVPFLMDEHPQVAAFMLSRVEPDLAARCLETLPAEMRSDIAARLASIGTVAQPTQQILEQLLSEEFLNTKETGGSEQRLEQLAAIINRLDRTGADEILAELAKISPEDAKKLRPLIFMFDDLPALEQRNRAKLLDRVPTEMLVAALHGMPQEFRDAVLQSLSARTRRMVESELPADGGAPRNDTVENRRKIADMAVKLARTGEISLQAAPEAAAEAEAPVKAEPHGKDNPAGKAE